MIGRRVEAYVPNQNRPAVGEERLRVDTLSSPGRFADVSFAVHAGEVVGFAGLVGAGRSEIANALFGLDADATGSITVRGRRVQIGSPDTAMRLGIGYVPEDRKRQGLVLSMRTRENVTLPTLATFSRFTWIQRARETTTTAGWFERLRVRADPETTTVALSGGNQQKIVLAKWLAAAERHPDSRRANARRRCGREGRAPRLDRASRVRGYGDHPDFKRAPGALERVVARPRPAPGPRSR